MKVLVDTNGVLRSVQKRHPACRVARLALLALFRNQDVAFLNPQNVAEFWSVLRDRWK